MATIANIFANLLSLPITMSDLAISETKNKLGDTVIMMNNELVTLQRVNRDYIEVIRRGDRETTAFMAQQIHSLDFFLPESGVYLINGRYSYLQKVAKRQWKKSFTWDIYTLSHTDSADDVHQLYGQTPITMYQDHNRWIWYNDLKVARVNSNGSYELINPHFKFEVEEFLLSQKVRK